MNLHEYQSKEILASYGVRIQRGFVANNVEEAVEAADKLKELTGSEGWVVKAQVHAHNVLLDHLRLVYITANRKKTIGQK